MAFYGKRREIFPVSIGKLIGFSRGFLLLTSNLIFLESLGHMMLGMTSKRFLHEPCAEQPWLGVFTGWATFIRRAGDEVLSQNFEK